MKTITYCVDRVRYCTLRGGFFSEWMIHARERINDTTNRTNREVGFFVYFFLPVINYYIRRRLINRPNENHCNNYHTRKHARHYIKRILNEHKNYDIKVPQ